ncbi:hypothetical protein PR202_gb25421 [Eleusine coracana subsp. coracana]|uniref:Uncharacterized protein n=1 Tax=Eleusine coracana subsp. coracana TaxID=191504 RepID=A0AAV5FP66_ELECO|nr:hypothetical protein PR202_gb25421 [Eleusine coracana subsp. coracana]
MSASLKSLVMVKCSFSQNFTVDCSNLVIVRCVAPERWVPLFKNLGSLVTGTVKLDDPLLRAYFHKYHEDYEFAQTGDEDSDSDSMHTSDGSGESSDDAGYSSDDYSDDIDNHDH